MTIRSYQFQVQALIVPSGFSTFTRTVEQDINLAGTATYGPLGTVVETELGITDSASLLLIPGGVTKASNTLLFTQDVLIDGIIDVTPSQDIGLTDAAEWNGPIPRSVTQSVFRDSQATYRYGERTVSIEQDLSLVQSIATVKEYGVTDDLGLTDDASRLNRYPENDLGLSGASVWGWGKDAENRLNLTDTVEDNRIQTKRLSDEGFITQAAAWYIESRCARSQRTAFHGEGGIAPEEERLEYESPFLMQSKTTGETVMLRSPESDNKYRYAFNRTNRRFFDNSADIYADDNWATEDTQIYTIVANKRDEMEVVWTFLQQYLGQEVLIKDWKGRTWNVIITNPGQLYAEDAEGYWTLDFEVVGDALDGEYVPTDMEISDDVSRAGSLWNRSGEGTDVLTQSVLVAHEWSPAVPGDDISLGVTASFEIV
ncbi:MAG: hypothetical protein GY906_04695 [bacterium]|nr:hypothetical protein [bacterium]